VTFFSITAPYWITYSGLVSIRNIFGKYEEKRVKEKSCKNFLDRASDYLFLTFIGPLTILIKQVIQVFGELILIPMAFVFCFDKKKLKRLQSFFRGICSWIMQIKDK
jgi:hypothetical protein